MELTEEKSKQEAAFIGIINAHVGLLDLDYLKQCAKDMRERASFLDSAAVLNPKYNPNNSQLLYKQAQSLDSLVKYVECLKECTDLKEEIKKSDAVRDELSKLFA